MTISVTAYEFYGDPTGDTTTVSTNRSTIADLSLKGITDPTASYYANDIQRPPMATNSNIIAQSMQRYISFRVTGNYQKIKNLKLVLNNPSLYQKSGGEYVPISDDTKLMYKLTNVYQKPVVQTNVFGISNGNFDGTLNIVTSPITLHPRLSSVSPVLATSRQIEYVNAGSYWTEFLVLQAQVYPGDCNQVGSFGKTGGTNLGGITGPLLTITIDEIGAVTVD